MTDTPIRCILIARSSKDRHDVSCESQLAELEAAAKSAGEIVVKRLSFPAVAHTEFLEDPDFVEILDEVKRKDRGWSKIRMFDSSRLSRNRMRAQTVKALLRRHGLELSFLKIPATGEEAYDQLVEGVFETIDQFHADNSRAGSIRGQKQNIRSGYRAGGRAPYGYRLKGHVLGQNAAKEDVRKSTLEPDPATFPIVQEYLVRRAAEEPRASIFRDFQARGIPSPSGNQHWSSTTGLSIERNLLCYQGSLVYGRHARRENGGYVGGEKLRPRQEWEVNEGVHPAAITREQADAIAAQNRKAVRNAGQRPRARRYLLTGFLHCGSCGGPMVGDRGLYLCVRAKRKEVACSNAGISAARIERYVLGQVRDVLLSQIHFEAVVQAVREAYRDEIDESGRDRARMLRRLEQVQSQLDRLVDLYTAGSIDPETIERKAGALSQEKADLEAKIRDTEEVGAALDCVAEIVTEEEVRRQVARFEDCVSDENREDLRAFLRELVEKVEITGKKGDRHKRRKVKILGTIPQFTRTAVASPMVASSNFITRLSVLREGLAEAA